MALDPSQIEGLDWQAESGQAALSGALLRALERLDARFLRWARALSAEEHRFPAFLPARELDKLDYFRSFPHLVTFPVALDSDPERLQAFKDGTPLDASGSVRLGECAPVKDVLTPAACYHFYVRLQGRVLERPLDLTTVATCFRREAYYEPLRRQWSFTMRELVRIGSAEEVTSFLDSFRARVTRLTEEAGLPVEWKQATDPFFNPRRNPKYLAQMLDPVKTELVFGSDLAIGSINFHRNYFGETFGISRNGDAAYSGCVAFGLERWLAALLAHYGPDEAAWPDVLFEGA